MKKILFLFLVTIPFMGYGQSEKMNVGLGVGLDYGGLGGKFTFLPGEKVGLFAGLGYNLDGAGYNLGALYKFSTDKRVRPYATAMYGYNGVISVEDSDGNTEAETYYGFSLGAGIELKSRKNEKNFWNFELLIPFRSSEFHDDLDTLKDIGYDVTDPWPINFSIGYHFGF